MKTLFDFIKESLNDNMKMSDEDKNKLLALDKLYADFNYHYRKDYNRKDLKNVDEEREKFLSARKSGIKYYPKFKPFDNHMSHSLVEQGEYLLSEFNKLDCYLSKFYIEWLRLMIGRIKFFRREIGPAWYIQNHKQTPNLENYYKAIDTLKNHPYEVVDESDRNISAKDAAKEIQKHIDKLGYEWDVELTEEIIPRMSVGMDKKMFIRKDATFSKDDIEGLKVHEVEGHIGRRYYGLKTGLELFHYGLIWNNDLDEGLAVWNSLNKVDKVKPNVYANIALKTIIAYQLDKMDFCELYDFCKSLAPEIEDEKLFDNFVRFKREVLDCSIKGGNGDDQSYFCGLQIVNGMNDSQRDDILKWNIGPGHINELPKIKQFFKENKFDSLI